MYSAIQSPYSFEVIFFSSGVSSHFNTLLKLQPKIHSRKGLRIRHWIRKSHWGERVLCDLFCEYMIQKRNKIRLHRQRWLIIYVCTLYILRFMIQINLRLFETRLMTLQKKNQNLFLHGKHVGFRIDLANHMTNTDIPCPFNRGILIFDYILHLFSDHSNIGRW